MAKIALVNEDGRLMARSSVDVNGTETTTQGVAFELPDGSIRYATLEEVYNLLVAVSAPYETWEDQVTEASHDYPLFEEHWGFEPDFSALIEESGDFPELCPECGEVITDEECSKCSLPELVLWEVLWEYPNGTETRRFHCRKCERRVEVTGRSEDFLAFSSGLCSECES